VSLRQKWVSLTSELVTHLMLVIHRAWRLAIEARRKSPAAVAVATEPRQDPITGQLGPRQLDLVDGSEKARETRDAAGPNPRLGRVASGAGVVHKLQNSSRGYGYRISGVATASTVFISYSREDKAFVERLHAALIEAKHSTWVDWQDIPPTAEWLAEVYDAIRRADAFVFVISPDSAVSKTCSLELAHAIEHNKRLIPVLYRAVEPSTLPPRLAAINWIVIDERPAFLEGVNRLVEAIALDLAWLRMHTRLTVRASEWESRGRNPAYLIGGAALAEAESALVLSTEATEPQPTKLQQEYVLASRKGAIRRQGQVLGGVTGALAVATRSRSSPTRNIATPIRSIERPRMPVAWPMNAVPPRSGSRESRQFTI
jgi:hypothetical protein